MPSLKRRFHSTAPFLLIRICRTMSLILICITLFCTVVHIQSVLVNDSSSGDVISGTSATDSTSSELTWNELIAVLKSKITSGSGTLNMTNVISSVNITQECRQSLSKFVTSLEDLETWAIRMADANGRLSSGILDGRLASLGTFDECLKIQVGSPELFRGQYCLLAMRAPLLANVFDSKGHRNEKYEDTYGKPPKWAEDYIELSGLYLIKMLFFLGTCVPSTCSGEDVNTAASHVLKPFGFEVSSYDCQREEQVIWSIPEIVAMSFFALIAVLCFFGTTADIFDEYLFENPQFTNPVLSYLRVFSVRANTSKLFGGGARSFACLDGLRVISFMCILTTHAIVFHGEARLALHRNSFDMTKGWIGSLRAALTLTGGSLSVETFFCISGFLLVSTTWKKLEVSGGRLNLLKFMLKHYLRLTPPHALAVAFYILTNKLGSGPLWNFTMRPRYDECEKFWWYNFLYINNCFDRKLCLGTTWFLSALMQCHLIGVILLCATSRWPIKGTVLGASTVVLTFAYLAWVSLMKNCPLPNWSSFKNLSFGIDFIENIHMRTYVHLCCYIIGMVFGYINLKQKTEFHTKSKLLGWSLAATLAVYVVCGRSCFSEEWVAVLFYNVFHRAAWAASMGWLILACCRGQGGAVGRFLSWQGFAVFSKLSFLAYLLHYPLDTLLKISKREVTTYDDFSFCLENLGLTAATLIASAVAYVTVQKPFETLTTRIFERKSALDIPTAPAVFGTQQKSKSQ